MKGMVHFQNVEKPVIIQGVQATFSPPTYAESWPRGEVETRIVVIGRDLDAATMRARFLTCIARRETVLDRGLGAHLSNHPSGSAKLSFAYMTALELKRPAGGRQHLAGRAGRGHARPAGGAGAADQRLRHGHVRRWRSSAAREQERALAAGEAGAIAGLALSVKDLVAMAGVPWTFGSRPFADNVPDFDAPAVERIRQAGGCIVGKSATSEFGCKAVCDSPLSGITRNPWNLAKTPGGSSGGAGASVAAGLTPFALGTDGGGSVRIPAALCGLFGIKAQFGRVPVFPVSAAPTLAHVGALARTVRDAALLLGVMAGHDRRDAFGVAEPVPRLPRRRLR